MSEFKHTPGPWQTLPEECDKPYFRIRGTMLGCRYKIANVLTPVYEGVHAREAIETRANARIIAAAPELLEALMIAVEYIEYELKTEKNMYEGFEHCSDIPKIQDDLIKARAAIAKATGANE